jgi:hypothetical protein
MQYNYQKYVELLEYDDLLRKQNKFLKDENKLKYLELQNYSLQINEYLHWSEKDEYLQLIEDFLSFKINGQNFESKFSNNIKPSGISFEFAKWVSEIYLCCDEFYPDFDEKDLPDFQFAKNEEDFRNAVSNIFPQIEKY